MEGIAVDGDLCPVGVALVPLGFKANTPREVVLVGWWHGGGGG